MAQGFIRSGRLLALVLTISGAVTSLLGVRTLLDPDGMMESFAVSLPAGVDLSLLISVLGSAVLSLGLIQGLAALWCWKGRFEGRTLGILCAVTLLLVAACAYLQAGSTEILLLDGIRGVLLLVAGMAWRRS